MTSTKALREIARPERIASEREATSLPRERLAGATAERVGLPLDRLTAAVTMSAPPRELTRLPLSPGVPLRFDATVLLAQHRAQPATRPTAERLHFTGVGDKTVYNPTAPFTVDGREIIAARVESRHLETDSEVIFFEKVGSEWKPATGLAHGLKLQDPCVTQIDGKTIIGGVRVFEKFKTDAEGKRVHDGLGWETVFYRSGDGLKSFELDSGGQPKAILTGPLGMKDIRLKQLRDGRVAVFTRPQNEEAKALGAPGGLGSVGFAIVDSLSGLTQQTIAEASLLPNQFPGAQWWGVNEIHEAADGSLNVLGHVATRSEDGQRHYYAIEFSMDPKTRKITHLKLLAESKELPDLPAPKAHDLGDVIFAGGIKHGVLYAGVRDTAAYAIPVRSRLFPSQ